MIDPIMDNTASMRRISDSALLFRYNGKGMARVDLFEGREYWKLVVWKSDPASAGIAALLGLSEDESYYYIRTPDKDLMKSIVLLVSENYENEP